MTLSAELTAPTETPGWLTCTRCGDLIYAKRFAASLRVCLGCGVHTRVPAPERVGQVFDHGSVAELPAPPTVEDPLEFVDSRPYRERLRDAKASTGLDEAVHCVLGTVLGKPLVAAVMDFRFLGGSLGAAVGERIADAAGVALRERTPLLIVTASGGARMQEGGLALMQMAKTSRALADLDRAGVLTVTVVTDPTYGGVAASFTTLADVILAEPGAHLGFAGPRVIEQTIRQRLPDGFQTAEFLHKHGLIDAVVPRGALRHTLGRLLAATSERARGSAPGPTVELIRDPGRLPVRDAWETVCRARAMGRPTTLDYIAYLIDDFVELHGDRLAADCPAVVGGLGRLAGRPIVVIGHQKGRDTRERLARNFGMPTPDGYRKAARLMRLAAKLRLPVVTFVDTPGAHPGLEAEERGQAWAIAENLRLMSTLPVPIVTVITGEGGSGGALALAVADRVLALQDAMYSVISPEGCAAILWKAAEAAPQAARALRLDARELLRHGIVDAVLPEPPGGAQSDPAGAARMVRTAVSTTLAELDSHDVDGLLHARHRRFSRYGTAAR
jgi:acyl-CoA carboxylase subunit beta